MQAQITVRLTDDIAAGLVTAAAKLRCKRSDVVRMALERFILLDAEVDMELRPYDRVKNLLGSVASGVPDLGEAHQEHLRRRFRRDG